jgi:hypothetical protein
MAVCDELSRALAAQQTERARLLQTLLHEVLTEGVVEHVPH